ncbi:WxL domain-containing protein [Enterococcus crotali]|uniref:WxL domain-containing protein n=1 Tax=Enterococcus crotali TaxID=1453587 RepID=UPI0004700CDF|nr:WxL domain-containing protein [Enterococcus crotali]OTP53487.1 hypothetical protein A5881_000384 [Enterococcus termitis]
MKLKKQVTATTAGMVTFASLFLGAPAIFAEEAGDGGVAKPAMTINDPVKSEAEISFSQNETEPTKPTGPGGEEIESPSEGETGMVGPLTIDYITKINFGNQKVSGNDATYFAELAKVKLVGLDEPKETPNYVQITDSRGSNAGWQLQVKQDAQFQAEDAEGKISELKGAQLKFANPSLKSSQKGSEFAPLGFGHSFAPGADAVTVVNATAGKGMGTWHYTLGDTDEQGKNSVSLSIPGDTAKVPNAAYKTVLTWTLIDSPDSSEITPEQAP